MERLRFFGSVLILLTSWSAGSAATCFPLQQEGEAPRYEIVPIPDPRFVDVLVVDAKTGDAVAGAVVTSFRTWDGWVQRMPLLPEELARILAENGPGVATDDHGRARVPRSWRILATAGDRTAVGGLDPSMASLRLELAQNVALTVLVEDVEGRPVAGVPVVFQSPYRDEAIARTDAAGRAVFSPLSLWYSDLQGERWEDSQVFLAAPLGEAVFKDLPSDFDPAVPVRLTLPPTGSLRLEVVDEDGNEVHDLDSLSLSPPKGVPLQTGERTVREWSGFDLVADPNPRLPFVGLGLRFDLFVGNDFQDGSADAVAGPKGRGEEVTVRVVTPRATHLSVRALDESGRPLADRSIFLCASGPLHRSWEARTDASGEVDITLDSWAAGEIEERTRLEVHVRDEEGLPILSGETTLVLKQAGRWVGSKDAVLSEPRVLFTGKVVDDAGSPVAGASVYVFVFPDESVSGLFSGHPAIGATSDEDGCFEARGLPPVGRMSAGCNAPPREEGGTGYAWSASGRDVEVGDRDVVFELQRTGLVVGTFVGRAEDLEGLSFENEKNLADDPRFVLELPHGTANLKLVGRHGMERQIDFREIPVLPGQMTLLGEIAIGGGDHTVHLTVLDDQGERIPAGWIAMPDPEEEESWSQMQGRWRGRPQMGITEYRNPLRFEFENGTSILPADEPLPPFAVGAPGFAPTVTRSLGGSQLVVLRRAPKVRLVADLLADCELPEGKSLIAVLGPLPDDPEWFRFGGRFEGRVGFGETLKQVPELIPGQPTPAFVPFGEVSVQLLLGVRSGNGYSGAGLTIEPSHLEIEETTEEQVFHLKIDAESFRRAAAQKD